MSTVIPTHRECRHCHTKFRPSSEAEEFCCAGCRFVHQLLYKRGLEDFYSYGETMSPTGDYVFHERDYAWIEEVQREAEKTAAASAIVDVQGISCAGCVWLIEAVFMENKGATSCLVNSSAGTVHLRWKAGAVDLKHFARDIQRFGYLLGPVRESAATPLKSLTRKLGLCGFLAMNTMLFSLPRYLGIEAGDAFLALFDIVAFGLATASIVIGGTYFMRRAWRGLRHGALHIDLPISLGLLIAYVGSVVAWLSDQHSLNYFDFVSIFTFLMLLGRWLQERTVEANRRRLLGLKLSPSKVRVPRDGKLVDMAAEKLGRGQEYELARNHVVPVRSRLRKKNAEFALSWITGEPAPRMFHAGDIVPSGAKSLDAGTLDFEALEEWQESQLAALLRIDADREWRNRGLEKLIRIYLISVLTLAASGFVAWGVIGGSWLIAFQVMISVLVVSCPCALGVSLPLLDDIVAAKLQRHGVYIREGTLWARLKHVRALLFDKTGTLTMETLRLANAEIFETLSEQTKSNLLRLVEYSLHPAAACLREYLLASGVSVATGGGEMREEPGMGIEWATDLGVWGLGRAAWTDLEGGGSVLTLEGIEIARFHFREELRPDAADQVERFREQGMEVFLLSGDDPARVERMGETLRLPAGHALGGLTPQDKADLVAKRWRENGLMLGDGANDSLAFDAAYCRGSLSADVGLLEHKADFYILGRSLNGLGAMFAAGRGHRRTARTAFVFALMYNFAAVSVSLAGWMSPLVAAVIMPSSSLISIGIVLAGIRISTDNQN